ncbi:CidA/LrgA family protein [Aureimonas endophytica]|uniref:CidA/LrgA family protein n=1 Tax=Aureimonas endophytica TaxID=2027858 RepID=A0A917E2G0_9HYPH|nr:CidA/LrgA family protein [Aureimonas endophytica]GGD98398.1 CidA/LrgA family protein [Aureimonas endophytica]
MLQGLFVLLACQLVGEGAMRLLAAPVPGPVAGLVLLLAYLALADRFGAGDASEPDAPAGQAADGILGVLGLFFVPVGVGVAQSYQLIMQHGLAILGAIALSTVATLVATVATFRLLRRVAGEKRP